MSREEMGLKGTRRLFLSLGAGEPTPAFSPYYHFLFEEPAGGGPLRLLEAEKGFPDSNSGPSREGVVPCKGRGCTPAHRRFFVAVL